jgi:hypothetical protein
MKLAALAREKTRPIASVAPEVKTSVPSAPSAASIRRRASSSCARAARPSAWGDEGFAQVSQARRIASAAAGRIGVVAA